MLLTGSHPALLPGSHGKGWPVPTRAELPLHAVPSSYRYTRKNQYLAAKKRQLRVAFYSKLSHLHPSSGLTQGDRPLAKLAVSSRGKQALKSSSQRRGGEAGRAGIFYRSHPFPCSLLPQAHVPRREVRLVPDGLVRLLEQGWAVGLSGCQQPWPLFPLGSLPRGEKGCGQKQSLASPSPGLPWGGSPTLQPPCRGFREGYQAESTAGSRSSPPGSEEREGGPCRYNPGMERG